MDNSDKSAGLDGSIARCSMPSNATHAILMESIFEPNANEDSGLASRNFQLDAVHTGAGRNVERLAIFVAPGHIAHGLGDFDCAEVFPFGRNNPHAAGTGAVEVSFFVHADAVWPPRRTIVGGIEKQCAVRNRSVRLHPIAHPDLLAGIRDVQVLLVRRKTDAVRPREVLNNKLDLVP